MNRELEDSLTIRQFKASRKDGESFPAAVARLGRAGAGQPDVAPRRTRENSVFQREKPGFRASYRVVGCTATRSISNTSTSFGSMAGGEPPSP